MILNEDWLTGFVIALLLSIPGGVWGQTLDSDDIEQLDEVEVTAARIAPLVRSLPIPLPELSTAVPLPSDAYWKRGAPLAPDSLGAGPPRLLQDNTALARANRTRVRYLEPARPAYPKRAREMGWEGTVLLRVEVRADGTVAEVKVAQTSGYTMLDQSAVVTARGWSFAPEMDGGFTMPTIVEVPVRFDLTEYAADELSK
jgi:periplasmic protein TonB